MALLQDYHRAIGTAAEASWRRIPGSAYSVLKARLRYDIGPRYHSLYDLIRLPEREWPEFIIDNGLKNILRKINPPEAREIVGDKLAFFRHCQKHDIPTIEILAMIDRNAPADPLNGIEVAQWESLLQSAPAGLFIKLVDGTWGIDAFVAERSGPEKWTYCDQQGSLRDLHSFCMDRLKNRRGWIVQPVLRNHSELLRIMSPSALGTVRAVTCQYGGEVELLFSVLRIPVGTNRADNFAHGSSGNLTAPIDMQTGRVGMARASRSKTWPDMMNVDLHPDTKQTIPGFQLPYWSEMVELVCRAQASLPGLCTLGWDVAITDRGPIVVEANSTYDVDLVQVAQCRGLKSLLLESRLSRYAP